MARALLDEEYDDFCDEIELVRGASSQFDKDRLAGQQTVFGTALGNFGVREMLDDFVEWAPKPQHRTTQSRDVSPTEGVFWVRFKIQANMDPAQRSHCLCLFRSV